MFRIRYRFNPEDDHNDEDLTHEIHTRTPPEGHYAVGDPLPILYLVQFSEVGNSLTKSIVYSTPFPQPMHDSLTLHQIVGYSEMVRLK